MALAARFPLKSTSTRHEESTSSQKKSTGPIVNELHLCIVDPEENENRDKKILDQSELMAALFV